MKLKKYLTIALGACILAFGLYNVHARCDISEGGALGASLLLYHWFSISPSISGFLLDLAAVIAGALILRGSFLLDSVYASACFSLWYKLFESFDPMLPSLADQPLAAAIVGALFVGVGTSLIVRHGCGAGADDALGLIVSAKTPMKLTTFYVFSDFSILLLSLTYIPFSRIIWSMLTVLISSGIIELITPKQSKAPSSGSSV